MWPFKRKQAAWDGPTAEALAAIVGDYLIAIPEQGGWEDEAVLENLTARGHDPQAAWAIVGLVPIFVGRHMMRDFGPQFSDKLDIFAAGRVVESHALSTYPPYVAICSRASQILRHVNSKALALHGAEVHAVNAALKSGSRPRDLRTTPVLLLRRESHHAAGK